MPKGDHMKEKADYAYKGLVCAFCKGVFDSACRNKKQKYCSKSCARKHSYNSGQLKKGETPWNKKLRGYNSAYPRDEIWRKNISRSLKGVNAPNWKGGVSSKNERERKSRKYIRWRSAVFKRDDYTCQHCGVRGAELHADHIKQFAIYKKERYNVDNGRTLCVSCHKETHTYGNKAEKL